MMAEAKTPDQKFISVARVTGFVLSPITEATVWMLSKFTKRSQK